MLTAEVAGIVLVSSGDLGSQARARRERFCHDSHFRYGIQFSRVFTFLIRPQMRRLP
jgi:hypothetical protein